MAASERNVLFLLGSARSGGNAEFLAQRMAAALPASASHRTLHLDDYPLPAFRDIRHAAGVYPHPQGNEKVLAEATLDASDLVIAAPLYWYSLPASVKLYLDYWSAWMRVPGMDFRQQMAGKRLHAVCVVSDEDATVAEPFARTLELTAAYMGMEWRGMLTGFGNRPGDVAQDREAVARADGFLIA
jgi:NAD(P)H-dependent FMN reductase